MAGFISSIASLITTKVSAMLLPCTFKGRQGVLFNSVSKVVRHMLGVTPPECFNYSLIQGLKMAGAFQREKHRIAEDGQIEMSLGDWDLCSK